jgi:3-phosphoglycerate kinase
MTKNYPKLIDTEIKNKTVVVRANLDIKLKDGELLDTSKIKALAPTLKHLLHGENKIIILGHLGNQVMEYNDEYSFLNLRFAIGREIEKQVKFVNINNSKNSIKFMEFGDVLLIENLIFNPEEFSPNKAEKQKFIQQIAEFCDYYVDESFGVDQTLASTLLLPKLVKNSLVGINYVKELETAENIKGKAKKDFLAIIGGRDIVSKREMLIKSLDLANRMIITGEIALPFLIANGYKLSENKVDANEIESAEKVLKKATKSKVEIILPSDFMISSSLTDAMDTKTTDSKKIEKGYFIVDIGNNSVEKFKEAIDSSKTILLSGTQGIYEVDEFNIGTTAVNETVSLLNTRDYYKVVGGEDTMAAINSLKIKHKKFNHTSVDIKKFVENI